MFRKLRLAWTAYAKKKKFLIYLAALVILLKIYSRNSIYYPQKLPELRSPPENMYLIKYQTNYWKPERVKKILVWTPFFDSWRWVDDALRNIKTCPGLGVQCEVTRNQSELRSSHAVVFHTSDYWKLWRSELPQYRHPSQVWVWFSHEATPTLTGTLPKHVFNWTMGYRRDSSAGWPYGKFVKKSIPELARAKEQEIDYYSEKSKFAVIHVSNCDDTARRYRIVHELSKHIDLDQFGRCPGKIICKRGEVTVEECNRLLRPYKFYLAFENSYCRDYITEKFWQSQNDRNQIPIVAYSNATLELLPPNSYINIFDFPNLKAVADKMIEVSKNKSLYNSYFEWKKNYRAGERNGFCNLCEALHENRTSQSYDLDAWLKYDTCSLESVSIK